MTSQSAHGTGAGSGLIAGADVGQEIRDDIHDRHAAELDQIENQARIAADMVQTTLNQVTSCIACNSSLTFGARDINPL